MSYLNKFEKDKQLFLLVFIITLIILLISYYKQKSIISSIKLSVNSFLFLFFTGYLVMKLSLDLDFKNIYERLFISLILNIIILPLFLLIFNIFLKIALSYKNIFILTLILDIILIYSIFKINKNK